MVADRTRPALIKLLPAPIGGLNGRDAVSSMDEKDAIRLTNWFPDFGKVRVRRGTSVFATVGTGSAPFVADTNPVETLAELQLSTARKLVAAAGAKVWEVSAGGEISTTLGTGFSNARWQTVTMNDKLGMVNGQDAPQIYDGSTLGAMTISGPTITTLVGINAFKARSYFIAENSQSFWYSAVNTLGGAVTQFPLGDVGTFGGELMQMATWTRDGGAGQDDMAVFLMSSGEVLVYAGSNPGDSADWALVGVFRIGAPLSRRAAVKVGGDVLVVTQDGPVMLSQALPGGRMAGGIKMTDKLGRLIPDQAELTGSEFGWQFISYPRGQYALINYPSGGNFEQYVVNLRTGAWCKFTGMDASCWSLFNNHLYFGTEAGVIMKADTGANDNGLDIVADGRQAYSYLGDQSRNKHVTMVGPLMESATAIPLQMGLAADFNADPDAIVQATLGAESEGVLWDAGNWDEAGWAGDDVAVQAWFAHTARGYAISAQIKVQQNSEPVVWNATRIAYEKAGVI